MNLMRIGRIRCEQANECAGIAHLNGRKKEKKKKPADDSSSIINIELLSTMGREYTLCIS